MLNAAQKLQHGSCSTEVAARNLQHGSCSTEVAARNLQHDWLQHGSCSTELAARWCSMEVAAWKLQQVPNAAHRRRPARVVVVLGGEQRVHRLEALEKLLRGVFGWRQPGRRLPLLLLLLLLRLLLHLLRILRILDGDVLTQLELPDDLLIQPQLRGD